MKRFLSLFLLILVLFLLPLAAVSRVRSFFVRLVSPVGHYFVRGNTGLTNITGNIRNLSTVYEDKQKLSEQITSLEQQVISLKAVQSENDALRKELGVTGTTHTYPKVLAHVVLRGSDLFDRTFTIDVGQTSGIKTGQPAVYQGVLVGRVISVQSNSAVIRSITSRESLIQAELNDNKEKGLVVGDGSNAYLTEITQGISIKDQDIVETSGLGGSLPEGILIGQTGKIQSIQSDASQKFVLTLSQDPTTIDSLFILLTDSR